MIIFCFQNLEFQEKGLVTRIFTRVWFPLLQTDNVTHEVKECFKVFIIRFEHYITVERYLNK